MSSATRSGGIETYLLGYAAVHQMAPVASGVYTIYSPTRWVCVGESDDIRGSLLRHLNDSAGCMNRLGPLSFSFELGTKVERMARWHTLVGAVARLQPGISAPRTVTDGWRTELHSGPETS
jgi:hypothetical protein